VPARRQVFSAALSRAVREELIARNVARLVELPSWEPKTVEPWSPAQALGFLTAAADDPLYPAFVLLLLYGMRRGEVLRLPWQDIDLSRSNNSSARAGARDLPLVGLASAALTARRAGQDADRARLGADWPETGLIFTTRTGRPVEPRYLVRSFTRLCDDHGIRKISLHSLRHTTASLLKDLGVPPRDAQIILGHSHINTTQQIYTHVDEAARLDAITKLNKLLGGPQ
jgi:integrase